MTGRRVLHTYQYQGEDGATITVLEGMEVMIEVDPIAVISTDELHDLAEWINDKATEISTKFATGEFQ
jgi:hypothetical protein